MPFVFAGQRGTQELVDYQDPPAQFEALIAQTDEMVGAELHVALDLGSIADRVRLQVFGLVEDSLGGYTLTSARLAVGVTF
jgi:hypothetical protein